MRHSGRRFNPRQGWRRIGPEPAVAAPIAAVQTALAFSGAVFGPPLFALIASTLSYRMAFIAVAACVLLSAVWQLAEAQRAG